MSRFLRWVAFVASLAAVALLLVVPFYSGVTVRQAAGGATTHETGSATLIEGNGLDALLVLAVPVVVASNALIPWRPRYRRWLDVSGAIVATMFSVLGAFTVGLYFLPTAAALWGVALWPTDPHSGT
jgi:hypothetical protein